MQEMVFSPSDFVAVLNQTLDYAYPLVTIEGELVNLRVSRGKWVYFDVKDEQASVKCFGTVYMLPGPIEEGMMVRVVANPRLHPLYNFSLNLQSVMPVGEGSIKKASDLLLQKLTKEGLFDESRKRPVPYAPKTIGLITSKESAAYGDFIKILNQRWGGMHMVHHDVQVQGEKAITDIVQAITTMNLLSEPEVIVITRGGGSADDLSAFSTEHIVRAVAGSRIPTLVAIGHEQDVSLAELAADLRASTPSNAAELLTPDKKDELKTLQERTKSLRRDVLQSFTNKLKELKDVRKDFTQTIQQSFFVAEQTLARQAGLLEALNPEAALQRGYAVLRSSTSGASIKSIQSIKPGDNVHIQLHDGSATATINEVQ